MWTIVIRPERRKSCASWQATRVFSARVVSSTTRTSWPDPVTWKCRFHELFYSPQSSYDPMPHPAAAFGISRRTKKPPNSMRIAAMWCRFRWRPTWKRTSPVRWTKRASCGICAKRSQRKRFSATRPMWIVFVWVATCHCVIWLREWPNCMCVCLVYVLFSSITQVDRDSRPHPKTNQPVCLTFDPTSKSVAMHRRIRTVVSLRVVRFSMIRSYEPS